MGTANEGLTPVMREVAVQREAQARFLAAFKKHGTVAAAAREAGVSYATHARWLVVDSEYEELFRTEAKEEAADRLEQEAIRRAVDGWEEPVFHKGELVSTVRKYSDYLLAFLLRAARPERFNERHVVSGPGGGPISVSLESAMLRGHERRQKELQGGEGGDERPPA